ncbi:PQQ-dependent sugar dehydrogenase [Micromonospora endophytica]|uniref:PQQ-dependent sugar dehydrogenase n=1 Tax=Micromonospora endophytica TaxID=515350 RepID=UPI001C34218C|nr:PQQ-dependent sugar dehydrogenase [Micromonospora endophytica]BCJ56882.1 hypothetical protein Jiend_03040 [Micromonospora endophytica]
MLRRRCRPVPLLAGLLVLVLSALLLPPASAASTAAAATPRPSRVPLTGLPDGRMLIAEKNGTVRAYHPDTGLAAEPVLDLTARIDTSGNERGLLGITPAPNFARTGILYLAYTSLPAGALTLARMPINAPGRPSPLALASRSGRNPSDEPAGTTRRRADDVRARIR